MSTILLPVNKKSTFAMKQILINIRPVKGRSYVIILKAFTKPPYVRMFVY